MVLADLLAGRPVLPHAAPLRALAALAAALPCCLDEACTTPGVLTPLVLGAVFEAAIVRKPGGVFYTDADVAYTIARATIVPALLDASGVPGDSTDAQITAGGDLLAYTHTLIAAADASFAERLRTAIDTITVFDPTCGAGALLLAALAVLEPLATACDARLGRSITPAQRRVALITGALHGGDLSPEAVALCALRLELAAAALGAHLPALPHLRVADALAAVPDARYYPVIIGNPPYVTVRAAALPADLVTRGCGNLCAPVIERGLARLAAGGRFGMIVPTAVVSTRAMAPLRALLARHTVWHSHYAVRPARLFAGVDMNLTITLLRSAPGAQHSTGYQRWSGAAARAAVLANPRYTALPPLPADAALPRLGHAQDVRIYTVLRAQPHTIADLHDITGVPIYYHSGGRYWRKALRAPLSSHYKPLCVRPGALPFALALLNSRVFHWWWIAHSNCMDVVTRDVLSLPIFDTRLHDPAPYTDALAALFAGYARGTQQRVRRGARIRTTETNIDSSAALDAILTLDRLLARAYGLAAADAAYLAQFDRPRLAPPRAPDGV